MQCSNSMRFPERWFACANYRKTTMKADMAGRIGRGVYSRNEEYDSRGHAAFQAAFLNGGFTCVNGPEICAKIGGSG